jgi:hypothetical protein
MAEISRGRGCAYDVEYVRHARDGCRSHVTYSRSMARIKMTAAVHRRISKRDLLAALRHAEMPPDIHRNRAYFIGIDSRGREYSRSSWLQMTTTGISGTPSMPGKPATGRTREI